MNPLFESYKNSAGQFYSSIDFNTALQNLAAQIIPTGMTPEQIVRQKIQTGEMTQAQFERYRQVANRITGRNI